MEKIMRRYKLRDICICTVEQQMDVLTIRNSAAVRKSMYNEHEISVNEHFSYIERLKEDSRQKVFVVLRDGKKASGVVSINQIDRLHSKADWAFYLDENERGGVGSSLEIFMLDFVFSKLEMEKLNCEVIETNPNVVAMHKKFGFVEEGFRRSNIEKDSKRIGVHFLGITKGDWSAMRETRVSEISEKVSDIEITLDNEEVNISHSVINKIQSARSKNNINWMSLLRLSVEKSPSQSLPLIKEIMKIDGEINDLTKDLLQE